MSLSKCLPKTNPKIILIGKANVGKSTLFNLLTQSRRALIKREAGTTRDVLEEELELFGKKYQLVDTGGMYEDSSPEMEYHIQKSNLKLIEQASLILFIVDGKNLLNPSDYRIYKLLRKSGKPFKMIVNKMDSPYLEKKNLWHFYELGTDELLCASFEKKHGIDGILQWIDSHSIHSSYQSSSDLESPAPLENASPSSSQLRIALIGRTNVGKSSLCNTLLKEEKAMVSPKAGTTHDSVEYLWQDEYKLIDTAGVNRRWKTQTKTLILSGIKSRQSLKKADFLCLVLDAVVGPSQQDSKWIQQGLIAHKRILVLINKMDLLSQKEPLIEKIKKQFHFFPDVPYLFISAKTGFGVHKIKEKIKEIEEKASLKIPTGKLNTFLNKILKSKPSKAQIRYITQTHHRPPAFMIFCKKPEQVSPAYRRFLIKNIQRQWSLEGIPIKLIFMSKKERT